VHRATIAVVLIALGCSREHRAVTERAAQGSGSALVGSDDTFDLTGCTPEACRALRACEIRFEAGPRTVLCKARLGLDSLPADFDETPYCLAACRKMKAGAIASCMREKSKCSKDHPMAPEEVGCAGSTGDPEREPACADGCADAKQACDYACPITSLGACMDCSAKCGEAWHRCWTACPIAPSERGSGSA
jgi:hypothetical protein